MDNRFNKTEDLVKQIVLSRVDIYKKVVEFSNKTIPLLDINLQDTYIKIIKIIYAYIFIVSLNATASICIQHKALSGRKRDSKKKFF